LAHPTHQIGVAKFADWVRRDWLWITVPLVAVMLVVAWFTALYQPPLWNVRAYVQTLRRRSLALSLGGLAVLFVLRQLWMHAVVTQFDGPTLASFTCQQTLEALRGPLWGPVHHVVYFGPLFALVA